MPMRFVTLLVMPLMVVTVGMLAAADQTVWFAGRGEIFRATLSADGQLSEPVTAGRGEAGMLAAAPDGRFLYATGQSGGEGPTGTVGAYRIDNDGSLSHLGTQPTQGRTACFVSVDATGRHVFVANFRQDDRHSRGSVVRLPVDADGSLQPVAWRTEHPGAGKNHPRQAASHPHSVVVSPANTLVAVGDLGIDRMVLYRFDADTGTMERIGADAFIAPPGSGPRHLAFHPTLPLVYSINESGGSVTGFSLADSDFGQLRQTIATGGGACADLHIHPTGRFLYGSNRGGDSIVCFAVAADGTLSRIGLQDAGGKGPRELALSPDGRFLLAINTGSSTSVVFAIDPDQGTLQAIGEPVAIPGLSSAVIVR